MDWMDGWMEIRKAPVPLWHDQRGMSRGDGLVGPMMPFLASTCESLQSWHIFNVMEAYCIPLSDGIL